MTNVHSELGELDEALATGTRALEIAGRLGDLTLRILGTSLLSRRITSGESTSGRSNWPPTTSRRYPPTGSTSTSETPCPPSVYDRSWLVVSLAQLGRFAEAAVYEAEAIRLAEPTHQAYSVAMAHWAAGTLHLLRATGQRRAH